MDKRTTVQLELTQKDKLLSSKGHLNHVGWAKELILEYNRSDIKAPKFKIKEWDYYCILSDNKGVAFTIADNSYLGLVAVTIFDFDKAEEISNSVIVPLTMGKFNMPSSSKSGDINFQNKDISLKYIREDERRIIELDYRNFANKETLKGKIILQQPDSLESMVIATPFAENKKAFYYNQKVNCLPAEGELTLGSETIIFKPEDSFGVLDWGRGVWTYSNTWYWGSASGKTGGKLFGFNIGYGFGDTSAASENMIFYDGKSHKIEHVHFHIPKDDYLEPWRFTSSDARFEMEFVPILDRYSNSNVLVIKSTQHQVFGRFTGTAILDDGTNIQIKDFLGFAEKVMNRW